VLTWCCGLMAVAGALLCWPSRPARDRLVVLQRPAGPSAVAPPDMGWTGRWNRLRVGEPGLLVTAAGGALAGWAAAGAGGAVAGGLVAGTVRARWRAHCAERRGTAATAALAAGLALFTAELRAGAHPAVAAQRLAGDIDQAVECVFETIAAAARWSGDVAEALRRASHGRPALDEPLQRVAAAWALAEQHGIGLAEVLDAVRRDLDHRVRAAGRLAAALAGPRATAVVLAALPLVGLLLGQAVGAGPWRVLTSSVAGQALLVAGSGLVCVGVVWSARLVAKVAVP
jgi:tight adherence protein B